MSYTNTNDFVRVRKGVHRFAYGGREMPPVTVAYTIDRGVNNQRSSFRIALRLLGSVIDELGWKPGDYVDAHEGTGASAGKLLLTPAERPDTGYKLSTGYSGNIKTAERRVAQGITPNCYVAIGTHNMGHHTMPMTDSINATPVSYRPFNGELLIDMPSWFKPVAAPVAEQGEQTKRGRGRKRDGDDR